MTKKQLEEENEYLRHENKIWEMAFKNLTELVFLHKTEIKELRENLKTLRYATQSENATSNETK